MLGLLTPPGPPAQAPPALSLALLGLWAWTLPVALMFRLWAVVRHSGLLYSRLWQNKACFCQGLAFLGLSVSPSLEPGL